MLSISTLCFALSALAGLSEVVLAGPVPKPFFGWDIINGTLTNCQA